MLPESYHKHLSNVLNPVQLLTLEMMVWLVQVYKQVKIERLAAHLPLPIQAESRRKHIQRFLKQSALSVVLVWLPLIQEIISQKVKKGQRIYLVLDRTQWKDKNLFMVGIIMSKRALPIYWNFLEKEGASNLAEQKALLRPVIKLLREYEIIILGDREFHSVRLAKWLRKKKVYFVLRQKKDTNIKCKAKDYQPLSALSLTLGTRLFFSSIKVTKTWEASELSMGIYWRRKYRGMGEMEPWYLLTNLPSLEEAIKAYQKRAGIEAMFRDCKTGGYNLEGSKASLERLTRLVLIIAIAYTSSTLKGQAIKTKAQQKYIARQYKVKKIPSKNSNFWIGLYGSRWLIFDEFIKERVAKLMSLNRNKLPFYQRGLRAMSIIQKAF